MMDLLATLFGFLIPPPNSTHEEQYGWRVRVGVMLLITIVGLSIVTAFAFGWPIPGTGFARAEEMHNVVAEIRENRATQIDGQILELRIKHCASKTDEARQLYWSKIAQLLNEYQNITGHTLAALPSCADL